MMDLVCIELLPPVLIADMQREARRWALVEQATPDYGSFGPMLAARFGIALWRAGCRIAEAGRRLTTARPLFTTPLACGCGD